MAPADSSASLILARSAASGWGTSPSVTSNTSACTDTQSPPGSIDMQAFISSICVYAQGDLRLGFQIQVGHKSPDQMLPSSPAMLCSSLTNDGAAMMDGSQIWPTLVPGLGWVQNSNLQDPPTEFNEHGSWSWCHESGSHLLFRVYSSILRSRGHHQACNA